MDVYQKPKVVRPAYTPEAVEAGCCLTSCGGSPSGMHINDNDNDNDKNNIVIKLLKKALKK